MNQRVIIVGAGGFLGKNLIECISAKETLKVIAITQEAEQFRKKISKLSQVGVFSEDVLQTGEFVLDKDDILINCAYPRAMQGTDITDGLDYIESVFYSAANARIKGVINISSQSVYDSKRKHAAVEEDKPSLQSIYATGKYCIEKLLNSICRDIAFTNIRLASLIGPGFDARVPNKMIKYALKSGKILVQNGQQIFGYLDVKDAACGISKLLEVPVESWKPVYNLGSQEGYSLLQIAQVIQQILATKYGINISIESEYTEKYENSMINSERLINDVGSYISMTLDNSLQLIIEDSIGVE